MKHIHLICFGFIALTVQGCASSPSVQKPPAQSAAEPEAQNPGSYVEKGRASYYSDKLEGRKTASGEPYRKSELTAAHRTLPFGTFLEVKRTDGRSVVVRVNDRGPYSKGRIVDLSRSAAETLGMVRDGVVDVVIRVVEGPGG